MIRYQLDDLGWYQFEWLVQALLKAHLGVGVEAWGGHKDSGMDAYCPDPLCFPSKDVQAEGPFVFQAKFVQGANASGAKPTTAILNAARDEATRIGKRIESKRWQMPRHYILVTNAIPSTDLRDRVTRILTSQMPETGVHVLGGNDICDLLDEKPLLRRSFPQLLSLRDLGQLLENAVNKEVLQRSASALEMGKEVVPVFVPTKAYRTAWEVLRQYHFCVLDGPPEMGKTAIAWMIATTQLSHDWQIVACDRPTDFHQVYDGAMRQVFVADDAFRRTEYDPTRGAGWEMELPRILPRLSATHWLLWTSRKHILERALKTMDLQGEARHFPSPGEVVVNATQLTLEEKALMLYRHARAAGLSHKAKEFVKAHARSLVWAPSFTPERIRRFVSESLPDLVHQSEEGSLPNGAIREAIHEAIRNPTDRMRKSFRALPPSHKWLLIALLDAGSRPSVDGLRKLYQSHCPLEQQAKCEVIIEELEESFVRRLTDA